MARIKTIIETERCEVDDDDEENVESEIGLSEQN